MPVLDPDLVLAFVLLDVAVILLVANTLGALVRRLGQPSVVGEIVAGVLVGPTLLGRTVANRGRPCQSSIEQLPRYTHTPTIESIASAQMLSLEADELSEVEQQVKGSFKRS